MVYASWTCARLVTHYLVKGRMSLDEKQSAYDLAQAGAVFLSPNPFLCLMLNIQWRYVITQSCHWDKGQTNRCMISLASKDLSFVAVAS